jgi:16S rRNA (guanine966-N2)-methyltransferase
MRVTGGELGGRRLRAPAGLATRPTTDKVRQALFNILGPPPAGARVLDLYAGSGALGIEALSRGAAAAFFVERERRAAAVLQANLADLGLLPRATLVAGAVEKAVSSLGGLGGRGPFDWIFADPPYEEGLLPGLLARLGAPGCPLVRAASLVIVEHPIRGGAAALADGYGALRVRDRRCYGQTGLSFYEADLAPGAPA